MINKETNRLETIQIEPPQPATASIIWLHGLGADGNDFASMVPALQLPASLPIRFIFPHAPMQPVTLNNGYIMRAWYDIITLEENNHADQQGIQRSTDAIHHLIEQEITRNIPPHRIMLGGFSQGAVISLTTGLTYAKKLAGIIALSGYLPFSKEVFAHAKDSNKSTPIFLAHGTEDTVVPFFLGQRVETALREHHYPLSWHPYPIAHSVCMEEITAMSQWIQKIL